MLSFLAKAKALDRRV